MYKTVRHGENSLQYTILPQQDDAASISAANNSSICGRSSAGVRRRARRGRTATILIMTLILACGVVGAAVVVPLLISTDLVALPSAFQRFNSNNNGHQDGGHHNHHGGHHNHHFAALQRNKTTTVHHNTTTLSSFMPEVATSEEVTTSPSDNMEPTSKTGQVTSMNPPSLPARANEVTPATKTPVQVTLSLTTEEIGTKATTQQQAPLEVGGLLEEEGGAKEHDHVGGSKKKALDEDMRNSSARILVSASMGKDNRSVSVLEETTEADEVVVVPVKSTERPKHRSWLEPRWPFADPSSYFQWTGYNGRDSLLLPLILGGAMLVLLLAICICYTLRRRRQKTLRRQTIGKISSDLQCGDKATLLPDGSEEE